MIRSLLNSLSFFSDSRTIYLNEDGSILPLNEKIVKRKGIIPSDVVGKNYSHISLSDKGEDYYKGLLKVAATKGRVKYQAITSEKGKKKLTNITLEAIHDEKKQVIGYLLTV